MIDKETLDELEVCAQHAADYTAAFTEAVKAQAEKHQIDKTALRQFVVARLKDKMGELKRRTDDLAQLEIQFATPDE